MHIFRNSKDMRRWSRQVKRRNDTSSRKKTNEDEDDGKIDKEGVVAFVPTMGSLHEGHLALVDEAKKHASHVVVSIYVNPSQFAPGEDFEEYPRSFESDLKKLRRRGSVDAVFVPENLYKGRRRGGDDDDDDDDDVGENTPSSSKNKNRKNESSVSVVSSQAAATAAAAPPHHQTWVRCGSLEQPLCGITRPHFFRGVATVVTKLFHIVEPDLAVFGQKDFQQLRVIETLVRELDFPIKVLSIPVVREEDGLAMSSRNALLTKRERQLATCIHRALQQAKDTILVNTSTSQGMTSSSHVGREFGGVEDVRDMVAAYICDSAEECKPALDYVEVLNAATLKPLSSSEEENLLLGGMRKEKNKRKEQTTRPSSSSSSSCVVLIAVAVFFGSVRLIDNITIDLT